MNAFFSKNIRFCKGIGEKRAEAFKQKNINTLRDLFFYFPRQYLDRRKVSKIGDLVVTQEGAGTFLVKVFSVQEIRTRFRGSMLKVVLTDGTGYLVANFFNAQQVKYYSKILKVGAELFISGKTRYYARYNEQQITNFEFEIIDSEEGEEKTIHTNRIVPVYSEFEMISTRLLRTILWRELKEALPLIEEFMPGEILQKTSLPKLDESLKNMHFPDSIAEAELARRRLAFDRLLFLQIYMTKRGRDATQIKKNVRYDDSSLQKKLMNVLPFSLTAAQLRVLNEISRDLSSPSPMNRLLQGDVGSGKTVVALLAMLMSVSSGHQSVLMAPTEILATQHFSSMNRMLDPLGLRAEMLVSGLRKKERQTVLDKISSGSCRIVVGTHALLQPDVVFKELSLVVVDEQHRFGVEQRKVLVSKGMGGVSDLLVMTATPIPRTLSLTLYGDLQLSVIDELPPGRKPVITKWYTDKQVNDLYGFIRQKIENGEKAFFIYPLVEESDKVDLKDVLSMYERFSTSIFKGLGVGLIHGQMSKDEKDASMLKFRNGETRILVSTTVVEVGVDVPDASIIVIEHADRFGLAQLHQLRGRTGRGAKQSYCMLVTPYGISDEAKERMAIMRQSGDGFRLAEEDLRMRGPGEFLGTRQSGMPDLAPADLIKDFSLLEESRKIAMDLLDKKIDMTEKERYSLYEAYKQEVKEKYAYIHAG